ncbi:LysR family transcriptional regulator [Ancylobacter radicis]|uniref:LysR family transcriptional regulator n=1 Tax=Ancylobacter radicis TaxID=2836179 RepID=A0ABS5RDA4_9HYPH|nr:LysR family transcriptional regulator [Ancylobacter radicis]MBS9479057.1 LysR family transcriptional regulator [Ancylobacter radicis]
MDAVTPTSVPPLTESDLRLLRIFRSVAEAGGLTAAERALGMERSTISRHLQTLEGRLGARLCLRGPAGFELTEFGRCALEAAISASEALEALRHDLNLARHVMTGELRIGVADNCLSNPHSAFAASLARFREMAPDVTVNLSIKLPGDILTGLQDKSLHLGVTGAAPGVERLRFEPLFLEDFRLYACRREGPPPSRADLARQGYGLVTRTNDQRTQMAARELKLERTAMAFGLEAVATLLVSGGFVGFLPVHYVAAWASIYRFVEVRDAQDLAYDTIFSLVTLKDRPPPPAAVLLARILREEHGAEKRALAHRFALAGGAVAVD